MDDGYESPAFLPAAEATADAAIAAKPNRLRQLAVALGLVKGNPYEVPLISPSDKMQLQLQSVFGAPRPANPMTNAAPQMLRSYATGAQPTSGGNSQWDEIAKTIAAQERIANELGGYSKAMMNSPLVSGNWR